MIRQRTQAGKRRQAREAKQDGAGEGTGVRERADSGDTACAPRPPAAGRRKDAAGDLPHMAQAPRGPRRRPARRGQAERSREMRLRLVEAAIASLIEVGYARTTAVEVCRRAGVTRGALFHHFSGLPGLLAAAMSHAYDIQFGGAAPATRLDDWVDSTWKMMRQPVFKAVIEVWLAARNDPEMTAELRPAIARYSALFSIDRNPALRQRLGADRETRDFFYLAVETMIGLALGRSTTPGHKALAHERRVIAMLKRLAAQVGA